MNMYSIRKHWGGDEISALDPMHMLYALLPQSSRNDRKEQSFLKINKIPEVLEITPESYCLKRNS